MPLVDRKTTSREQRLIERAHQYLPGGSLGNIYRDIVIHKGLGGHVWDVSGNEYVDYLLGSGPMLIGHAHPEVIEAVRRQLERGMTFFANNEPCIELAEQLVRAVPCAEMVRFTSSGTEATHYAMRAARAFRGRDLIVKFEGGFHGMNDYALMSMAPAEPADFPNPVPDSGGIPASIRNDMLIAPFNDIETTSAIIERYHDELAAVIVEPIQRLIPPKPGFLADLRQITKHHEIPLIFDEVVTAFRFALGGAQEYYGVVPDLCALSKAISAGFPLGAVAGRADLMANFDPAAAETGRFMPQIGTLSGNPIAAVASLACLDILKRPGTYDRLFDTGRRLMQSLQRLLDEARIPARVIGEPPMFDVVFTESEIVDYRSTLRADKHRIRRFTELMLTRGIFRGDTKMYVSIAHTQEDVDRTIDAFADAVEVLKNQ